MDFDDLSATIRSRLSGPIFFPYILSFAVVNWKALFLLFFSEGSAQARIVQFDANVTLWSLFIIPPIITTALILGVPQLKWIFGLATANPIERKKLRDAKIDHVVEERRLLLQKENARLRVEIAENNKRADTIAETIENLELKKTTEKSFIEDQPQATSRSDSGTEKLGLKKFIDGIDWLKVRSEPSLEKAKMIAMNDDKPLLLVAYDPDARDNGDLVHASNAFFRYKETQELFSENYILHLSPILEVQEYLENMSISTERPVFVLFSASFKMFDRGRLSANADNGFRMAKEWLNGPANV